MNQSQLYAQGPDKRFHPCLAIQDGNGDWVLKVDTEIEVDAATMNISNIKIGSTDGTKNNLRFLKVLDNGTVISISTPLDLYEYTDEEKIGNIIYYGFTDVDENWYILENDTNNKTARYFKGSGSYPAAWTAKGTHAYDYFFNIF